MYTMHDSYAHERARGASERAAIVEVARQFGRTNEDGIEDYSLKILGRVVPPESTPNSKEST